MTRGTVNVKLRPIKLAFLVNPKDKESLLKAIEINTFLWGGMYNPIIPTYKQISSKWKKFPHEKNLSAKSVVSGYLDNFDPDYVVPMGECVDYNLDIGYRKKIDDVSEILEHIEKSGVPNYGIGLFEVLKYFFAQELKFQRKYPLDLCVPRFGTRFSLFLASVFGVLPENIDNIFWEDFAEALEAKKIDCTASNYTEFFDSQKLFLRRMTEHDLKLRGRRESCIFFLDATKSLDIMDYWNLRAIGWAVIPVPKQFTQSDITKVPIWENCLPDSSNPETYRRTTILKSRSISEDDHKRFLNSLEESKIVSQTWYPQMWDESAREADHVECCELISDTVEHDVSTNQETIHFKTLDPPFTDDFNIHAIPSFANEIEWNLYDYEDKVLFAEVIPKGDGKLANFIVGYGLPEERGFSKRGVVHLASHSKGTLYLANLNAEDVFTRWLQLEGWAVKLSPPGRIAKQMLQQLRGIRNVGTLARRGIIQLLNEMNGSRGKSISEESVQGRIEKIANQAVDFKVKGEEILQHLIATKVFQLGMKIQCPICTKRSWYSVKGADYELQCPECLAQFFFPSTSKEVKWSYRTLGPFSSSNQAEGAYTVLLTLRFFSFIAFSSSATTPLMSFTVQKDGVEIEVDLALFFQKSKFENSKPELILAECKTFNSFQKKDAVRMVNLGKAFPEAVLVFATLNECLSEEEKMILRPIAHRCRKFPKYKRSFNPVLILTGTELFSEAHLALSWQKAGHKRSEFTWNKIRSHLLELCDFTQQIYLDMDPWDQSLENESEP